MPSNSTSDRKTSSVVLGGQSDLLFKIQYKFLLKKIASRQRSLGLSKNILSTYFTLTITILVASSVTLFLSFLFLEDLLSRLFSRKKLHFQKYISPRSVSDCLQVLFMIVCLSELITLLESQCYEPS